MPTYEYACRACGEHVEVVQSFREDPLTTCGACGGALRKVFAAAGIIFKGSGYYVTDSRKAEESGAAGRNKTDKKKSDASTDDKSAGEASKSTGEASKSAGGASKRDSGKPASGDVAESA